MGIGGFIGKIIWLYQMVILARVFLSWIPHNPHSPAVTFLYKITEPVLERVRRVTPPIGGIDISPIIVIIALWFLQGLFR